MQTLTVARHQTATRYARIIDALTHTARRPKDTRPSPGHQGLQNVQIALRPHALRLTAADGFILTIVELPLPEDLPAIETETKPAPVSAHALRAVANDLRKGSIYDPHLTLTLNANGMTLSSQRSGVSAAPMPNPFFPDIESVIPDVADDADCQRTAVDPKLMATAARICAEIDGHMTLTAISNSGPLRIDCTGRSPARGGRPRAVIAIMPTLISWDDPEAIRLRPDGDI